MKITPIYGITALRCNCQHCGEEVRVSFDDHDLHEYDDYELHFRCPHCERENYERIDPETLEKKTCTNRKL